MLLRSPCFTPSPYEVSLLRKFKAPYQKLFGSLRSLSLAPSSPYANSFLGKFESSSQKKITVHFAPHHSRHSPLIQLQFWRNSRLHLKKFRLASLAVNHAIVLICRFIFGKFEASLAVIHATVFCRFIFLDIRGHVSNNFRIASLTVFYITVPI